MTQALCTQFSVLDDYLSKPEPIFNWRHIPELSFKTLNGNQAYVLNVTSLEYLDTSKVYGPKGSKWDHEVIIIVPKHMTKPTTLSSVYLATGCASYQDNWVPRIDEDLLIVDQTAKNTGAVSVAIK